MVLIKIFPAVVGAVLLMLGGAVMAADYRADEFLGLDLSKAVLSPKRLGPPAEFAPVPLEAKGDIAKNDAAKIDTAKIDTAKSYNAKTDSPKSDVATTQPDRPGPKSKALLHRGSAVAHARVEKRRGAARTKLAHRNGNPLDAQARDTRIHSPRIQTRRVQTWPCNSGGICDWKQ